MRTTFQGAVENMKQFMDTLIGGEIHKWEDYRKAP